MLIQTKYKDKKEAQEFASALVVERIQSKIEKVFAAQVGSVEEAISGRLEKCSVSMNRVEASKPQIQIPFDAKGAFTGTAIGATVAAGLGAYASTMGVLGGYAVAAQGVGILSSLGLGFAWSGGTAGIMSGIAAVGGPIVVTVAIAAGVALMAKRLFGESWQRRLSKQLIKVFQEERVAATILENVDSEFASLESIVLKGCLNLKEAYHSYIADLQNMTENPIQSRADLAARVDQLREDLAFFVGAPWAQA